MCGWRKLYSCFQQRLEQLLFVIHAVLFACCHTLQTLLLTMIAVAFSLVPAHSITLKCLSNSVPPLLSFNASDSNFGKFLFSEISDAVQRFPMFTMPCVALQSGNARVPIPRSAWPCFARGETNMLTSHSTFCLPTVSQISCLGRFITPRRNKQLHPTGPTSMEGE